MKIAIRKIAGRSQVPGEETVLPTDQTNEFRGELISPIMPGHPVVVVYWRKDNERVIGKLTTTEVITRGPKTISTTDGIYAVRFPETEDRIGRLQASHLVPVGHGKKFRVPMRLRNDDLLRARFARLLDDPYTLEIGDLPMGAFTGFSEALTTGVQKLMLEWASQIDLEEVEKRLLVLHRALSGGIKRRWQTLADVDLRDELVVIPSALSFRCGQGSDEPQKFVSVIEPNHGRVLHATDDEFPLDESFIGDWRGFWRRLQDARTQRAQATGRGRKHDR